MSKLIRTERGWGGHFIANKDCMFRRNTLLEYGEVRVIVSTVGNLVMNINREGQLNQQNLMRVYAAAKNHGNDYIVRGMGDADGIDARRDEYIYKLGMDRQAETMAFHAKQIDVYWDADVSKEYPFESNWCSTGQDDNEINNMHEAVVAEISAKLSGVSIRKPVGEVKPCTRKLRIKKR